MSKTIGMSQKKDVVVTENLQMVYRIGKVEVPALRGVDMTVKEGDASQVIHTEALANLCQMLFSSNEFLYID